MKIYIEKLDRSKTTPDGKYKKLGVFSEGTWYSCLQGKWNEAWQAGQEIDVEVKDYVAKDGKVFKNIQAPPSQNGNGGALVTMIQELSKKMDLALAAIESLKQSNSNPTDDIPF